MVKLAEGQGKKSIVHPYDPQSLVPLGKHLDVSHTIYCPSPLIGEKVVVQSRSGESGENGIGQQINSR